MNYGQDAETLEQAYHRGQRDALLAVGNVLRRFHCEYTTATYAQILHPEHEKARRSYANGVWRSIQLTDYIAASGVHVNNNARIKAEIIEGRRRRIFKMPLPSQREFPRPRKAS